MKNSISKSYSELLKDPRWQKKRLRILERDKFECQSCNDTESTLNVHHCVPYRKDTKIWEYKDTELVTLCENCHKEISSIIDYCRLIIMAECYCIDTATEIGRIMNEIEGMNKLQLENVWRIIKLIKQF